MSYIVYYQVFKSDEIINSQYNPRQDLFAEHVVRGSILDDAGNVLAETKVDESGNETRFYPYGDMYAHVVGYASKGKSGIELEENFSLLTSNAFFMEKITNEFMDQKDVGDQLHTTLNHGLQQAAYQALGDYEGAVVILEPRTGKILAMVSKNGFDPNTIDSDWDALIESEESILLNRATYGSYVPGSIFKTVTLLEYIKENTDYESYTYECTGSIEVDGTTIACSNDKVHGVQNLEESYANSCNTSFVNMGLTLDLSEYGETAEDLLFDSKLPGTYDSKESEFVLNEESNSAEVMMTAIGQGDTLVSPYHMAMLASSIANGGNLMTPYIVDYVSNHTGSVVSEEKPKAAQTLMTTDEAMILTDYMQAVVEYGTATNLSGGSYTVAGKTGTAEYSSEENRTHSWFMGFTNPENPDLAFAVVVEESDGGKSASSVVGQILSTYYQN